MTTVTNQHGPTWEDYARAESFLPWNVDRMLLRMRVAPNWIGETDRFWYRVRTESGYEFIYVHPETRSREPAFDHVRLAAALSTASGKAYVPTQLPFTTIELIEDGTKIQFDIEDARWVCDLDDYRCTQSSKPADPPHPEKVSPDGRWAIFVRDYNLWLRPMSGGDEIQITTDGEQHYDYASLPESRTSTVTDRMLGTRLEPAGEWSPDSRKFLTHRLDERHVPEMHLIQSVHGDGGRPKLHSYRYALPEDERLPESQLLIVDIESRDVTPVRHEPLLAVGRSPFESNTLWWVDSEGAGTVAFVSFSRYMRDATLYTLDIATGSCQVILKESAKTQLEPSLSPTSKKPMHWISADCTDVVWFSERDGWGHLYLYDGTTGEVRKQITQGAWVVRELVHVDPQQRVIFFTAGGREAGRDPYYRHLYRVDFDGSNLTLLSPEDADHVITCSPCGGFFVDVYSRVDLPPAAVVRDHKGQVVVELETGDVQRLLATGWRYPERFQALATDGVTEIHGVIIYPTNFDPSRSYPVIDGIYPGPQVIETPKSFPDGSERHPVFPHQALAELGFIIVIVDGRGTPYRSKAFIDEQYGKLENGGGLVDHMAAMRQLAATRPYMDLSRVGIYGHSGGGYASVRALLAYPDFFKVAVSSAGNHDQRSYFSGWGNRYIGPLCEGNYAEQVNGQLAGQLQGKLLLVWGEMDDNVHPAMTIQLIDELIKANKDVDLLILPNSNHVFADLTLGPNAARSNSPSNLYFVRRTWDYFVQHLLGETPPREYRIRGTSAD